MKNPAFLDKNIFELIIKSTPLVSIDFIIKSNNLVLLGKRNNPPARDFWFVPGGRILKNESIELAMRRIFYQELGNHLTDENNEKPKFNGLYQHFYKDCFSGNPEISTHYIVISFVINIKSKIVKFISDEQHSELIWWDIDELLKSESVHQYTKNYFN